MANGKPLNGFWAALILILLTALMLPAAWYLPLPWRYVAVIGLMLSFMITLGIRICGRPAGILINERNLISLARFQLVLWTVIILSAYLTAALGRIKNGSIADALAIGLDEKLWGLLGISTASLIGSPLIQSTKKVQEPKAEELKKAETALNAKGDGETKEEIAKNAQGVLYANADIKDAAFSDMFERDEVGNTAYIDMAKVQMFFFTVVAALSYGLDLFKWISAEQFKNNPAAFPPAFRGFDRYSGNKPRGFPGKQSGHTYSYEVRTG